MKKFILTGQANGAVIYQKVWTKEPSKKIVRMLKDRHDNRYGAYLNWKLDVFNSDIDFSPAFIKLVKKLELENEGGESET